MPKVSVIIPNFNNARYIQEAIQSVLNQTLKDIEVIIVDDCSTDNSWEILQKLQKQDSRIKIIRNVENSGAGISRNVGLDIASGEFIKFLDSDDTMNLDVLEYMYNTAKKQNSQIVCGYMQSVHEDGSINKYSPFFYKRSLMLDQQRITPETPGANAPFEIVGIGDALYSRQLFDNVKFPKLKWEDFATIPIIKYGIGEMFYIDKPVYNYRIHQTSTTKTDKAKKYPRILDIVKCCDILRKNMPTRYQEKMDSMECSHVSGRILEVCNWKDCSREDKERIISALYRIMKIDVPNYYENKFICQSPFIKKMNAVRQKINDESEDISSVILTIKHFLDEPINLSNYYTNYDTIITAYNNFVKNMDLLQNSPNSELLEIQENGKNLSVRKIDVQNRLIKDLQNFYSSIERSNDYSNEQKNKILNNLFRVCIKLVPNTIEHLLIPDYPKIYSYIRPEFENLSREECMSIVENIVHSSDFQKYSMERMAAHSMKKTPSALIEQLNKFRQNLRTKKRGREFDE